MPRRGDISPRPLEPDKLHNSRLVQQVINKVMADGKKSTAEKITYQALDILARKSGKEPVEALEQSIKVLTPAFYALDDVRLPMIVSVFSVATNYLLNLTFIRVLGWGHAGLAFSTSLVATIQFIALMLFLRRKIRRLEGRRLMRSFLRVAAAAVAMGVVCAASTYALGHWLGVGAWARLIDLAITIPLSLAVLYAASRALDVEELSMARSALLGRAVLKSRNAA